MMYGFVTEFEFFSPESIAPWRESTGRGQWDFLEEAGPGEPWGEMRHAVATRAAAEETWFIIRIETFGNQVGVDEVHRMRLEAWRSAFAGRELRPMRAVYSGRYPHGL